ncbi:MAG: hypothetical protein QNJ71_11125 [Acidimicrobiia bacterium]|nr:hypothetical protein [Acidimicrobiia bacterium]
MTLELVNERALTQQTYQVCGQTVSYTPITGTTFQTLAIIEIDRELVPATFEGNLGEENVIGRIEKASVPKPCRGDKITDADGVAFELRQWSQNQASSVEWDLILVRCDG